MIERKSVAANIKALDDGSLTLTAAVFGNVDRQGEVILPGAFVNLPEFVADGWIALAHDWDDLPIASVEAAYQDGEGLKITARFHTTGDAQEARTVIRERIERGKSVKASIGFRVLESGVETRDGQQVRTLIRVELYEASIVNLPANPRAGVSGVKHWADDYEAAFLALKEGRVLSTRNRQRLAALCERMRETAAEVESMLAETMPPEKPGACDDGAMTAADCKPKAAAIVGRARATLAAITAAPYL